MSSTIKKQKQKRMLKEMVNRLLPPSNIHRIPYTSASFKTRCIYYKIYHDSLHIQPRQQPLCSSVHYSSHERGVSSVQNRSHISLSYLNPRSKSVACTTIIFRSLFVASHQPNHPTCVQLSSHALPSCLVQHSLHILCPRIV